MDTGSRKIRGWEEVRELGCDIHAFIEYSVGKYGMTPCFAEVDIDRNYLLFSLMAGVRNYAGVEPVAPPRGIPQDLSWWAKDRYTEWVPEADRQKKAAEPSVRWWDEEKTRIVNPDWHTPSWLTARELHCVKAHYFQIDAQLWPVTMDAVVAAMEALPDARLVFWFDN